jgi:hypothetical protein
MPGLDDGVLAAVFEAVDVSIVMLSGVSGRCEYHNGTVNLLAKSCSMGPH